MFSTSKADSKLMFKRRRHYLRKELSRWPRQELPLSSLRERLKGKTDQILRSQKQVPRSQLLSKRGSLKRSLLPDKLQSQEKLKLLQNLLQKKLEALKQLKQRRHQKLRKTLRKQP